MSALERTVQQLYPLGAATGRPLSLLAAGIAPVFTLVMVARDRLEISSPLLAVASLVLVAAASVTVFIQSSPLRAPFTNQSAVFTMLWANAAMLLAAASTAQTNAHVRDDWGPMVVGIMVVAIAPYRPPRELAVAGVFSSILAGFVVLLQLGSLENNVPPIVHVIVAVTPILILTIGAARFGQELIPAIERWRRRARVIDSEMDDTDEETIARSVQQDRVTILNRDIVPFFAAVLARDAVTREDALRARDIANSVRAVMVAEADRSWLHVIIDHAVASRHAEWLSPEPVVDPRNLATRMNLDQRSAVRAFVSALFSHPSFSSHAFRLDVAPDGDLARVTLRARLDCTETQVRSELSPFFAVLRILFSDLRIEFTQPALTLQFSYDE